MKVFAKVRSNQDYASINIANAVKGFEQMGIEVIKYEVVDEIYQWVSKDDIVLDFIQQVGFILSKFNVIPEGMNYPKSMGKFLGRRIWRDTINHINACPELWNIFVKPVEEKVFTGKVIRNTSDLVGCGNCNKDYEVLCSDIIDIKREFRAFITYDKIVDIKPYTGDWRWNYNVETIEKAIEAFKEWKGRPMGCSIDFAVTADNKTVLLEVNDGYALGCYGLDSLLYAKLISARWSQLLDRPDECQFTV